MDNKTLRNMLIGLAVLVILTPLGLLAIGETFGEWGNEELKDKIGYVPEGMEKISSLWEAPLPDYALPGFENFSASAIIYIISALLGVAICGGLLYYWGRRVTRNRPD
ncbi:MAG TPA: hypothetical protein PLI05_06580 [Methanotrichaceae archaeon]|nr:hypothetical protein [Methanotrichaceae archaeon]HQF16714.1 hypothetical protein [Methanotrichaceae archaeon]HQI91346.1 hypothetical protein [Methanotrichaceae archaeon]HQJ28688.1 hypothetical protein [Methanotrichaceae archaeon]